MNHSLREINAAILLGDRPIIPIGVGFSFDIQNWKSWNKRLFKVFWHGKRFKGSLFIDLVDQLNYHYRMLYPDVDNPFRLVIIEIPNDVPPYEQWERLDGYRQRMVVYESCVFYSGVPKRLGYL